MAITIHQNPANGSVKSDGTGTYYAEDFNEILECVDVKGWTRQAKMRPFTFIPAMLMDDTVNKYHTSYWHLEYDEYGLVRVLDENTDKKS